jgi:hypothetical protein
MIRRPGYEWAAAALPLLLLAGALGCQQESGATARRAPMSSSKTIAFTSVGGGPLAWSPSESGFGPQCLLIRSQAAWGKIAGTFSMNPERSSPDGERRLASVEFKRESILAVTLGEIGSTGFDIELQRIDAGPPAKLVMKSKRPAPDQRTGAMMTHPFHLVILEAVSLPDSAVFELDGKPAAFERHVFE